MSLEEIINKIVDEAVSINTGSLEPGVEMVRGLSLLIDKMIKDSVSLSGNLSVIIQGILIGAFRNRSVQLEAHKTIRLLVQEIVDVVLGSKGDMQNAVDGLLKGMVVAAKEHNLNLDEAVIIVNESLSEILKESKQ